MKLCGAALALAYAGLMAFAVYKEKTKDLSTVLIAAGCLSLLAYMLLNILWHQNVITIIIPGMLLISAGTLRNGIKQNRVHLHHHIIRFVVEAAITAICWMGGS